MHIARYAIAPFALALCLIASIASAGERTAFDQAAFDAAQKAGKPILVEVHAPWCPVCKAQDPILNKLRSEPEFKDLQTFSIDFDSQKDLLRAFKVSKQSTLIVFKGAAEVGRSTGVTDPAAIEALLAKSL
jgi:thiol-disulfide isomerase/thioredoxin